METKMGGKKDEIPKQDRITSRSLWYRVFKFTIVECLPILSSYVPHKVLTPVHSRQIHGCVHSLMPSWCGLARDFIHRQTKVLHLQWQVRPDGTRYIAFFLA